MQRGRAVLMHSNFIGDESSPKETFVLPCCLGNFQLVKQPLEGHV